MASRKAGVFISHCGKVGPVRALIDALVTAFGDDFMALVDEREIRAGGPVTEEVGRMIRTCDAAIVIVNQRALKLEDDETFGSSRRQAACRIGSTRSTLSPCSWRGYAPTTSR